MKFTHIADCHLGGWTEPEMAELNFKSFQFAIDTSIKEKVDFLLIAGDLFDSPYPSIEVLKDSFGEFRKLNDAKIPVFIIAGSHDYSASGRTFLDVLERAGFCRNVSLCEEKGDSIFLSPTIFKNAAIYGFSGRKSGLEVSDISKIKLHDSPGMFKILMLHTAISDAVRNDSIPSVNDSYLPAVDYLALGHLHINYARENRVYAGPTFPNNISELEELGRGSFYIFDNGKIIRKEIPLKEIYSLNLEVSSTIGATDNILGVLENENLKEKIVIVRLSGILQTGRLADIDWKKISSFVKSKEAYTLLRSTTKVHLPDPEIKVASIRAEKVEENIIREFCEKNPSKFNSFIHPLIRSLGIEKQEDERLAVFEERLILESKKVLEI